MLPAALDVGIRVDGERADAIALSSRDGRGVARARPDGTPIGGPPRHWARYVCAVAAELHALGRPPVGFEGRVTSSLPIGAGLSSSAALEVAVATALCAVAGFAPAPLDLALACQRAEHRAVGVPCGPMDQAAATLARAGHALLLDTGSLAYEHVRLPARLAFVVVDSGVERALEHTAYAQRRQELLAAAGALPVRSLAEADLEALELAPVHRRRLRHVVTENARVRETVDALRAADLERLGDLFEQGHASLRDDLEVSTPELDRLVELARAGGAYAARLTGAGFGGSVVALAEAAKAGAVGEAVARAYRAETGYTPAVLVSRPGSGARELAV